MRPVLFLLLSLIPCSAFAIGAQRPRVAVTEAAMLYNRFANLPGVNWNHAQSGCFERARLMTVELDRLDIDSVKVFAEDPRGLRVLPDPTDPEWLLTWRYHVAPAVRGQNGVLLVLDPALLPGPAPVAEWIAALTARPCPQVTEFERPLSHRCVWYVAPSSQVHRPRNLGIAPDSVLRGLRIQ